MKTLLAGLFFFGLSVHATNQPPSVLGTWYVVEYTANYSFKDGDVFRSGDSSVSIFRLVIDKDHRAQIIWQTNEPKEQIIGDSSIFVFGTSVEFATWYLDSSRSELAVFTSNSYRFDYTSNPMAGSISKGVTAKRFEPIGRCIASRNRTQEWEDAKTHLVSLWIKRHNESQEEARKIPRQNPNSFIQAQYFHISSTSTTNARLNFVISPKALNWGPLLFSIQPSFFSIAVHQQVKDGYLSSNALIPLASLIALLSLHPNIPARSPWYEAIVVPQALGNFDLNISLPKSPLALVVSHSTDCFFFYKNSKILPESKFGIMLDGTSTSFPLQARVCYCIPWVHGYAAQRENHLSFMLGCAL